MIPEQAIVEWRRSAPWEADSLVEQDLIISRALVEMYSVPEIARRLAFRGGTALYKLHLRPAARYSEDIDLVQVDAETIGETLDLLRSVLDPWLGIPQRKLKEGRVNLVYRFGSEGNPPVNMRLKIEVNSREHFTELGLAHVPFDIDNQWFQGSANITTFSIDELLGTKLRALYQRKKGRDLFDLWFAIAQGGVNPKAVIACFLRYMREGGHAVTRAQFEANLHEKSHSPDFRGDMDALLRPGLSWNFDEALQVVLEDLVARLSGDPWKGDGA
ncbi:MAG: nucleotidyl transferase AbiEii/AbiGii toxin family protein [Candidatus Eisenbacteria bacterium]